MALDVDPARLLRDAVAAGGPALERIDPSWTCQLAESLVLSALEVGDRDAARHWAERARALAAHTRLPLASAKAASAEALVLSAEDDHETAVAHARDGLVRAAAGGPVHVALARSVLGRVLARAGEREQALRELQAAADALTACGQQRAHDVAAREIRRLGGRASGRVGRAAGAEGLRELTAREREIAALVADGVGNKQIGRTLHISDKTVANILSAIYAKLGLRGRTELAALVAGQPIDGREPLNVRRSAAPRAGAPAAARRTAAARGRNSASNCRSRRASRGSGGSPPQRSRSAASSLHHRSVRSAGDVLQ